MEMVVLLCLLSFTLAPVASWFWNPPRWPPPWRSDPWHVPPPQVHVQSASGKSLNEPVFRANAYAIMAKNVVEAARSGILGAGEVDRLKTYYPELLAGNTDARQGPAQGAPGLNRLHGTALGPVYLDHRRPPDLNRGYPPDLNPGHLPDMRNPYLSHRRDMSENKGRLVPGLGSDISVGPYQQLPASQAHHVVGTTKYTSDNSLDSKHYIDSYKGTDHGTEQTDNCPVGSYTSVPGDKCAYRHCVSRVPGSGGQGGRHVHRRCPAGLAVSSNTEARLSNPCVIFDKDCMGSVNRKDTDETRDYHPHLGSM